MSKQSKCLYEFGPFRLDVAEHLLLRDGGPVALTPRALETLVVLVERRGHLVEKEELLKTLWPDSFVEEHNLANNISTLRKALGERKNTAQYIETVPKRGYRFVASVRELTDEVTEVLLQRLTRASVIIEEETTAETEEGVVPHTVLIPPQAVVVANEASSTSYRRPWWRAKTFIWPIGLLLAISSIVGLYFSRHNFVPPLPPMKVVPFTTEIGEHDAAAFSPDGNQIAFGWSGEKNDNWDIYVKSIGGERALRLTTSPGLDMYPTWSPDGQQIAFVRNWEKEWAIFTVPATGGTERKLLSLGPVNWHLWPKLDWSLDGKFIASSHRVSQDDPAGILLFSLETGERHTLTSPPAQSPGDSSPVFSPDSQTLAFVRHTTVDTTGLGDLYLVPITGGEPKRLTFDNAHIDRAAWTADGREIIFSSSRLASPISHSALWRIPIVGGTPERLAVGGDRAFSVAVSSRGHRLAYTQWGGKLSIYRLELPASTGQPGLPVGFVSSTEGERDPQFSSDGQRVAFASDRSGFSEIWTCNSDGSNPAQFTFLSEWAGSPRWSPDGRQIAFDCQANGDWNIYVASAEGGPPRRLTTDAADDNIPSWSRDGQWIYFASRRSGDYQLWKMPARGGAAVQLTRHGGLAAFESTDGKFVYYTKESFDGFWHVPVEGGEETLVCESCNSLGMSGYWAVVSDGIYFLCSWAKDDIGICFFNFATHRTSQLTKIAGMTKENLSNSFAVSPDRRSILFTQAEGARNGSLMLVENFR